MSNVPAACKNQTAFLTEITFTNFTFERNEKQKINPKIVLRAFKVRSAIDTLLYNYMYHDEVIVFVCFRVARCHAARLI